MPGALVRVREIEETGGVHLQIALRTFQRGPEEPSLTLVGVAHIGEPAYYADLEERLDAHDLVLFEGVGPIWAETDEGMSDRDRVSATKSRIRLIGISAMQRRAAGDPVRTIEDTWAHASGYEARLVKASAADAWRMPAMQRPKPSSGPLPLARSQPLTSSQPVPSSRSQRAWQEEPEGMARGPQVRGAG